MSEPKLHTEFWSNGLKKSEITYLDGKLHGSFQEWYSNGNKRTDATYVHGKLHGVCNSWYLNGKSSAKTIYTYINGILHGLQYKWSSHHNSEIMFVNGKPHGTTKYTGAFGTYITEYAYDVPVRVISDIDSTGRECVLPRDGEFIAWKICLSADKKYVYVQLKVPKEARRITPLNFPSKHKGRVEYAMVEKIIGQDGTEYKEAESFLGGKALVYKVGEVAQPDGYNDNIKIDCGQGISVHLHKDHCDQWLPLLHKFKR